MEFRLVSGDCTYSEVIELDYRWRLPTIFELMVMQKDESFMINGRGFWSSSYSKDRDNEIWLVDFFSGCGFYSEDTGSYNNALLISNEHSFNHITGVPKKEIVEFKKSGKLPSWHPPIAEMSLS